MVCSRPNRRSHWRVFRIKNVRSIIMHCLRAVLHICRKNGFSVATLHLLMTSMTTDHVRKPWITYSSYMERNEKEKREKDDEKRESGRLPQSYPPFYWFRRPPLLNPFEPFFPVTGSTLQPVANSDLPMTTDSKLDSSVGEPCEPTVSIPVRKKRIQRKTRKLKSMIQGKEITISGGKLTNVEGDYHEHNTTYVIEEAPKCRGYVDALQGRQSSY